MTKEEKELLLKDLCARLPYGVKYVRSAWNYERDQEMSVVEVLEDIDKEGYINCHKVYDVGDIKPYLRHISDMTMDEVKELVKVQIGKYCSNSDYNNIISIDRISMQDRHSWSAWLHYKTESGRYCQTCFIVGWVNWETTLSEIDWLNSHNFDYRGLIEKGLALKAPKGMYEN